MPMMITKMETLFKRSPRWFPTNWTLFKRNWDLPLLMVSNTLFNEESKEVLLKSLQENFISDSLISTNDISDAWNYAFLTFDCCGVNRVQGTTNDFDLTPWCTTSGECQQTNAQIPRTCCVGVTESNYKTQAPQDCYQDVKNDYNTQGCYERFQELVKSSSAPVIEVAITVMVIELLGFVFAIVLCKQTGSEFMAV